MDGTRSSDNRGAKLDKFQKLGTTNSVVDIVDQAVISNINCLPQLQARTHKFTRVWKNALTDIDLKPKHKLVPFLGDVENVLYINIYHYWSHSACRRLWHNINSLRQLEDEQYEDK